ncbi:hypothetical protein NMG60_11004366, partial [Bertholletia excelsa]
FVPFIVILFVFCHALPSSQHVGFSYASTPEISPEPGIENDYSISSGKVPVKHPSPPLPKWEKRVVIAAVATAAISLVVVGMMCLVFYKLAKARQRCRDESSSSFRREAVEREQEFGQGRMLKGLIVDENGLDVLYLRKNDHGRLMTCFSKVWINPMAEEEKRIYCGGVKLDNCDKIQETPLLLEPCNKVELAEARNLVPSIPSSMVTEPPPRMQTQPPPAPPPPLLPMGPVPAAPLPPISAKGNPPPPPSPPGTAALFSSAKPPPASRGNTRSNGGGAASAGEIKLKPLHWDKVVANADHSMVWDEINDGSFRYDNDLIEALFGYTANNSKSPKDYKISSPSKPASVQQQIFLLEPRNSQNTAIVLRSLPVSRKEILDAVHEGQGLNSDVLEKLIKISPTQEEISRIVQFSGDPTKLADAESFLYFILKAVPTAFIHFKAMAFRSNYDSEILQLKESLQALQLGCKELRTRGIFFKLLEATLKAGNCLNAGTARGNAQGFNLTALQKLSYVKSSDGKTNLLNFVVEQVVRSEGKRIATNKNLSLRRRDTERSKTTDPNSDSLAAKEERENEYLVLGLPALENLGLGFTNVKKAAAIDYDGFSSLSNLTTQVAEIKKLLMSCSDEESEGFVREMKGFLEESEGELKMVREEVTRVMELVKRTTAYYQAGALKEKGANPLQLFVIVKDFLDKVDQVCQSITKSLQKKNVVSVGLSSPPSPPTPTPLRFQAFDSRFMQDKHGKSIKPEDDF